ncbi:MAG: hypothetical protein MJ245_02470 [Clostridia bacterium]|nr:hypothetical protein [Clostridia bacterium]
MTTSDYEKRSLGEILYIVFSMIIGYVILTISVFTFVPKLNNIGMLITAVILIIYAIAVMVTYEKKFANDKQEDNVPLPVKVKEQNTSDPGIKDIKENYLDSLRESDYYKSLNENIYRVVVMLLAFAIFIGCMAGLVTTLGNLGMLITTIVLSVYVGFALKIYESLYYKDKK